MDTSSWPNDIQGSYRLVRPIGKGGQGEVWQIQDKSTYEMYALKRVKVSCPHAAAERKFLRQLRHRHVISLEYSLRFGSSYFLVLEFMEGGDLWDRIRKYGRLSEDLTKYYFYQVTVGLAYLHSNDIAHRDLKPNNILLSSSDTYCTVKIADFGYSKLYDASMRTVAGTPCYIAPEVFSGSYSNKADIWSLGMVLHSCLSGRPTTYSGLPSQRFPYVQDVSSCCNNLLFNLLQTEPRSRPSASNTLSHSWLQGYST